MTVKSKLIQAILLGFLGMTLQVSSVEVLAQNTSQTKVKKQKAPKKQKSVRTTTTRAKSSDTADEKRPSFASAMGFRGHHDALNLKSSVALIIDRQTHEVLFEKNSHAALPIASITKLMTSLVVMDAQLPMDEGIGHP